MLILWPILGLLTVAYVLRRVHHRQLRGAQAGRTYWTSPSKRAEIGAKHPVRVASIVLAIVSIPWPIIMFVESGQLVGSLILWVVLISIGVVVTMVARGSNL